MDNYDNKMNVTLGGKEFTVPLLVARENRIIDPIILKLLPIFANWQDNKNLVLSQIGEKEYDALHEMVFVAINRLQPEMTKEKLLDLPITLSELINSFSVIAKQTGIFEKTELGEGNGKAKAS
jgi:hypothetical protein